MKHNLRLKFILVVSIALSMHSVMAQSRKLAIDEAIVLSITNSKQLKNSQAKIDEATAALKQAIEKRLPEASVSASHIRLNSPHIDIKSKNTSTPPGATTNTPARPTSATYGIANVTMPLYAGLQIRYGIRSSKYLQQAAQLDADYQQEEVIVNTIDAYNNLYKAREAVDLVKESLGGAQQRVQDFVNLEKNGIIPRNDLLKAELQESNIELSLLDAENNWKLANVNMDLMLGLPDTTTLETAPMPVAGAALQPMENYVQLALQNRKDIAALNLRKQAATTGIKAVKGQAYPSIALTGGYIAADIPSVLTVTNAINIGVGVNYNIASLWKTGKIDEAKAREKQVLANQAILADAVHLQVVQAYETYLLSNKKIEVYKKSIEQAEENYRIVKNKFNNTLATTTDLLDADIAQLQARLNAAFATADAGVAYSKLLHTAGQLQIPSQSK